MFLTVIYRLKYCNIKKNIQCLNKVFYLLNTSLL